MSISYLKQKPITREIQYESVIDAFAESLKRRIRNERPRSWAVFWRVWSDEVLVQRQMHMHWQPNPANVLNRGQ